MIGGDIKIVESISDEVDLRGIAEKRLKSPKSPLVKSVSALKIDQPVSRNKRTETSLQKLARTLRAPPNLDRSRQSASSSCVKPSDPRYRRSMSESPDNSQTATEPCNFRPFGRSKVSSRMASAKKNGGNDAANSENESKSLITTICESEPTRHDSKGSITELSNTFTHEVVKHSKRPKHILTEMFEQGDFENDFLLQMEELFEKQSEDELQDSNPYQYSDEADNRSFDTAPIQISPYWDDRMLVEPGRRFPPTFSSATLPQISAKARKCYACRAKSLQTRFTETYPFDDDASELELGALSSDCNKRKGLVDIRKTLPMLLKLVIAISTVFFAIHFYRNAPTYLSYCDLLSFLKRTKRDKPPSFLGYILGNIIFTVNYALTVSVRLIDTFIDSLLISPFDGSEENSWWHYLLP